MKYDGSNPLHVQQARAKLEKLIKEQKVFELTEKKPQRSLNQNKYFMSALLISVAKSVRRWNM